MRASAFWVVEASVGAALAWLVATEVLHRPGPLFAPVAAWVCLGFKPDRAPRKVAELGLGATLGVLVGDAAAFVLRPGPLEIMVTLIVAALIARFLDSGDLFTMQSGVNAIVILAFAGASVPGAGSTVGGRWIDALTGAAVAFVIAVLLPRRPTVRALRYARSTMADLARLLERLAEGLQAGEVPRLAGLQGQRDALGALLDESREALRSARDVTRLNPALRAHRATVDELWREHRLARRALRTTDMLVRQALGMTEEVGPALADVASYVAELARAAHRIAGAIGRPEPPLDARDLLLTLAGRLAPLEVGARDWRPVALMSLVRALTVDLLQLTGLSKSEARSALADTWGRRYVERDSAGEVVEADPDDRRSAVWGAED